MRRLLWFALLMLALWPAKGAWSHPVTVDGDPGDWVGTAPGTDMMAYSGGEFIWTDSEGDDFGDGGDAPLAADNPAGYSYPDTSLFAGTEADLLEFRVTTDPDSPVVYLLIKTAGFTFSWQPIVAIMVDMDHVVGAGQVWVPANADLKVSPENAWEFSILIKDGTVLVQDADWNDVTGNSFAVANPDNGYLEAAVDVSQWPPVPDSLWITVVTGLGDFGHFREVDSVSSTWIGGGGVGLGGQDTGRLWVDPDAYDLAFVPADDQANDLNTYSDGTVDSLLYPATIRPTTVALLDLTQLGVAEGGAAQPRMPLQMPTLVNGILRIRRLPEGTRSLEVLDVTGRHLRSWRIEGQEQVVLDLRSLGSGVFFLRIQGARDTHTVRFIQLR